MNINDTCKRDTKPNAIEGNVTGSCSLPTAIRLPPAGSTDPLFGLTRSFLNSLILPTPDNDFSPPVKSYSLRRKGARKGVRLIDVQSLTEFVKAHQDRGHKEGTND